MPYLSDQNELIYSFTDNKALQEEYFRIREFCYRTDLGLESFSGIKDPYDEMGKILIVIKNKKIIGGARIVGTSPQKPLRLPLEEENFRLSQVFPEMQLENTSYCEFTRLAILPEHRNNDLLFNVIKRLTLKSIQLNYKYLFSIAPYIQSRCYRKIFNNMGLAYEIQRHIKVPDKETYKTLPNVCLSLMELPATSDSILNRLTRS